MTVKMTVTYPVMIVPWFLLSLMLSSPFPNLMWRNLTPFRLPPLFNQMWWQWQCLPWNQNWIVSVSSLLEIHQNPHCKKNSSLLMLMNCLIKLPFTTATSKTVLMLFWWKVRQSLLLRSDAPLTRWWLLVILNRIRLTTKNVGKFSTNSTKSQRRTVHSLTWKPTQDHVLVKCLFTLSMDMWVFHIFHLPFICVVISHTFGTFIWVSKISALHSPWYPLQLSSRRYLLLIPVNPSLTHLIKR